MHELTTPEAESQAEAPKIVFDEAQKERINSIVSEASKRAGSEARAEAKRLQDELDKLRTQAPPPDADAALELRTTKAQLEALKKETQDNTLKTALLAAVSAEGPFDANLCADLLRQNAKLQDGRVVFLDPSTGEVQLGADFNPVTAAEAARQLSAARPYLIRGRVMGGAGSRLAETQSTAVPLSTLFGKDSDGGAANRLALHNPQKYRELRRQAQANGLVR
jgi:hypothetical protein